MATYTDKLKLIQQDAGVCNWKWSEDRNKSINDAVDSQIMQGNATISGGTLSGASGLAIDIDETVVSVDGTEFTTSAGTLALTGATVNPEEQNWVWVDSAGTLQATTTPPTGSFAMIGLVDTGVASVDRQSDLRQARLGGVYENYATVEDMIINPRFVINQRVFDGDWSLLTAGDFGYDRWRKGTVASTIIQPIKDGNYEASESYYLFGTGVTSAVLTAPVSGTWEIEVPDTATEVHLVKGLEELPVRRRTEEEELQMCLPYARPIGGGSRLQLMIAYSNNSTILWSSSYTYQTMRSVPIIELPPTVVARKRTSSTDGASTSVTFKQASSTNVVFQVSGTGYSTDGHYLDFTGGLLSAEI